MKRFIFALTLVMLPGCARESVQTEKTVDSINGYYCMLRINGVIGHSYRAEVSFREGGHIDVSEDIVRSLKIGDRILVNKADVHEFIDPQICAKRAKVGDPSNFIPEKN